MGGASDGSSHEEGRAIYNFRCYYCHGYSGDARTLAATYLDPPPRVFSELGPGDLDRASMIRAVREGRPGTAMKSFSRLLSEREIERVVDFVREEFMTSKRLNTRYHTAENGWPDHERYRHAYPFATGEIALDTDPKALSEAQAEGRRLFLSSCITCHDRARVEDEGGVWDPQAVSYPRLGFRPGDALLPPDAVSGASPFAYHEAPPDPRGLSGQAAEGGKLFQANCAFCHGADGSGRNWIGAFLEPHARDLTDAGFMSGMTRERLRRVIREGLTGTSMPAWGSVLDERQIEAVAQYIHEAIHPLAGEPRP